ncbi:MAG TPA: hypothetical protein VIJ94_06490 [Caulobacteraceae bacterium]
MGTMPTFQVVRFKDFRELPERWEFEAPDHDAAKLQFQRLRFELAPDAQMAKLCDAGGKLIEAGGPLDA